MTLSLAISLGGYLLAILSPLLLALATRRAMAKDRALPEQIALDARVDAKGGELINLQELTITRLQDQIKALQERVTLLEAQYTKDLAARDAEIVLLKAERLSLQTNLSGVQDEKERLRARNAQYEIKIEELVKALDSSPRHRPTRRTDDAAHMPHEDQSA